MPGIEGDQRGIVELCRLYFERFAKRDPDEIVQKLNDEIGEDYEAWSRQLTTNFIWEASHGMEPYHDVVTYAMEHITSQEGKKNKKNKYLLALASELDEKMFFFALGVYADRKSDREGVRRAWDSTVSPDSPFRIVLRGFRHQSSGGTIRGKANEIRDRNIRAEFDALGNQGILRPVCIARLARSYGLSKERVRQVVRKTKAR